MPQMQRLQIPFPGGEFEARAPNVNAQRTVNLYPEVTQSGGKNRIVLYSTPGLDLATTAGVGPIRSNAAQFKGKLYFVSKDELYSLDTNQTATFVGTLNTESGRCVLAAGRDYLMVVDGSSGYTWDGTSFLDLGTFAKTGTEQVTNGTFASDSDWSKGTGWTISGGTASCDGSQDPSTSNITQSISPTDGTDYIVTFTVTSVSAGGVTPILGTTSGTQRISAGTYVERITAGAGSDIAMHADADFVGSIDNVSIYEAGVLPSNPTHVTYLDGYFIVNRLNSDQWDISANENPTIWDPLDFTTASKRPDDVLAHEAYDGDLFMVGEQTTEIYDNTGNADFPFERYPNGILEWGIDAKFSLSRGEPGLFWLARSEQGGLKVVQAAGLQVQVISNPSLEQEIEALSKTDDAIGWVYSQSGHTFYWLTFPTANRTFVVDIGNGLWHERQYGASGRHRANGHGYLDGTHYVFDYANANVYSLDLSTYTDNGEEIHRIRRAPVVHKDCRRILIHAIEIEFEAGKGLTTGQGSDPQAMLALSKDGGHTWSNDIWRPMGKIGEYANRAVWRKLGRGREFITEVTVTDPIPVTMIAAYADVSVTEV